MREDLKEYFVNFFNLEMVKKNNLIDNKAIIQNTINNHMN